jgi:L-fuconolactonase
VARIDAHQHFWHFDPARDGWITDDMRAIRCDFLPESLGPVLTANGIDACIAVQADQSDQETRFLLDLARRHAFIRGVVGWVDLRSPRLEETLEALAPDPLLCGVRHVAQAEPDDFFDREDVVRGIGCVGRSGLTYDILVRERQLPSAIALVSRLPDQPFVLDHLAKPRIKNRILEPWATLMRDLARRPNVSCKLSGLVTEADWRHWRSEDIRPYLDVALDAFGPDRLMFGSDWPVCLVAAPYEFVLGIIVEYVAALSDDEQAAILGGNAVRSYGLGD